MHLCENTFVKREDMNRRVKKINSGNYVFCISIHQNTYSDSKYKGAQVFYNEKNHSLNKELAEGVQFSLRTYLKNTTRTVVNRNNIYLLNKVTIPIIIVECGFLTNVEEAHQLISSDYQITNFFNDGINIHKYMYHVGVDSHNCTPINLEDIISEINKVKGDNN